MLFYSLKQIQPSSVMLVAIFWTFNLSMFPCIRATPINKVSLSVTKREKNWGRRKSQAAQHHAFVSLQSAHNLKMRIPQPCAFRFPRFPHGAIFISTKYFCLLHNAGFPTMFVSQICLLLIFCCSFEVRFVAKCS